MTELGIAVVTALSSILVNDAEATLLFAGDAMMHQKQLEVALSPDGAYDFSGYFSSVAPLVSDADYAVVNLETPLAGGRFSGYPMFNAPESYALSLIDAGFDLLLTANNHTLDRHDKGLKSTVKALDAMNIDHIGTYPSAAARDAALPFVKNIKGFKVAFLNYTYGTNGIVPGDEVVVDYIDRALIKSDIASARSKGAELVCVAVHWGDEYKLLPNGSQRSLADFFVEQGADMVIGGHPHVIQPMEMRQDADGRNRLVVYSLGNFISNMKTRDTRGGAIARVVLRRDDLGKAYVHSADYDLVFTIPAVGRSNDFHLVFADSCAHPQWRSHCSAFVNSARNIFDKHNINVEKRKCAASSK